MVEYSSRRLDASFQALAHPMRREILERLRAGDRRVTDLASPYKTSLNTVSKHLKVLERAGLIERQVRGREHHVRLAPKPMQDVTNWIRHFEQFWNQRLDALAELLAERRQTTKKKAKKA